MDLTLFVVQFTYSNLDQLKNHAGGHAQWIERHAATGTILLAGPTPSFDGGSILASGVSRDELTTILHEDPFYRAGLVTYDVIEFKPRRGALRRNADNPLYLNPEQTEEALAELAIEVARPRS